VERGVIANANQLYDARQFPSVVAVTSDALETDPEQVPLLLIRARAYISLRRDLDAQADLRDIIRLDPGCGSAFRLLGTLAARRDEHDSAAIFFREALRLDPHDREASEWLAIVGNSAQARRMPSYSTSPVQRTIMPVTAVRSISAPARHPRFARGTETPTEAQLARGSEPKDAPLWKTPPPRPSSQADDGDEDDSEEITERSHSGASQASFRPRPPTRGSTPELPGFGEYLVASGILTRERLRAAQAYQRSMKVQLGTAIVTLGLATPQRIEWAAVSHQSQLAQQHR
jgi:tetratricopeptide (TPR) repeat protein